MMNKVVFERKGDRWRVAVFYPGQEGESVSFCETDLCRALGTVAEWHEDDMQLDSQPNNQRGTP